MLTLFFFFFSFSDPSPTDIYTLSLHDALPISLGFVVTSFNGLPVAFTAAAAICLSWAVLLTEVPDFPSTYRSEEHTSELQSLRHLVCRLLLEKKKIKLPTLPPATTPDT